MQTAARLEAPSTTYSLAPVAELRGATKRYGGVTALDSVDLTLTAGGVTALLGPNGAGKTTAIRLLLGLTKPTTGSATLFGGSPSAVENRRRVGVMLQVSKVPESLKVGEHLHLFSSYYPAPMPRAKLVEIAGLEGIEDRKFGTLSGGQRQRVLFAIALCGDPELIFLDEPTVGLDVEARRGLWSQIARLAESGRSVLLTTHYLEEADALAGRIVVIDRGRVIADGTPAEIKRRAAGREVRCRTRLDVTALEALPGARSVRRDGDVAAVLTSDAEQTVRQLLALDPTASDLQVSGAGLEEAFLSLTSRGADGSRTVQEEAR